MLETKSFYPEIFVFRTVSKALTRIDAWFMGLCFSLFQRHWRALTPDLWACASQCFTGIDAHWRLIYGLVLLTVSKALTRIEVYGYRSFHSSPILDFKAFFSHPLVLTPIYYSCLMFPTPCLFLSPIYWAPESSVQLCRPKTEKGGAMLWKIYGPRLWSRPFFALRQNCHTPSSRPITLGTDTPPPPMHNSLSSKLHFEVVTGLREEERKSHSSLCKI